MQCSQQQILTKERPSKIIFQNEINFFMSKLLNHKDAFRIIHCTNSFKEQTAKRSLLLRGETFWFWGRKKVLSALQFRLLCNQARVDAASQVEMWKVESGAETAGKCGPPWAADNAARTLRFAQLSPFFGCHRKNAMGKWRRNIVGKFIARFECAAIVSGKVPGKIQFGCSLSSDKVHAK